MHHTVLVTTIQKVSRKPSSRFGNPRKVLHTDHGVFTTTTDGQVGYAVSDYTSNERALLTFAPDGQVIAMEYLS